MKKTLSLLLAALMLTGTLAASAGAEDPKTTISLTKEAPAPLAYEIVVPETAAVTGAGETSIGAATVENVENAAENTVISYTAVGTDFTADDGSGTIPADYFLDAAASTPLAGETVKVYESGAIVTNPPEIYVSITESDWESAAPGDYTATVTYTFDAEEAEEEETVTLYDIFETVSFITGEKISFDDNNDTGIFGTLSPGLFGLYSRAGIPLYIINEGEQSSPAVKVDSDTYTYSSSGASFTFHLSEGKLAQVDVTCVGERYTFNIANQSST